MKITISFFCIKSVLIIFSTAFFLNACALFQDPISDSEDVALDTSAYEYKIGTGDALDIFVWRNPEVSASAIPVRPDGRISSPLVDDMVASGKTPSQLGDDIEEILSEFIKDPLVTVTVRQINGGFEQQVRVVGEAANPSALAFSENMTVLDVMIAVGGLTEFANGNKATLVRNIGGERQNINVRLDDLLRAGKVEANKNVYPGDILIIPEALF